MSTSPSASSSSATAHLRLSSSETPFHEGHHHQHQHHQLPAFPSHQQPEHHPHLLPTLMTPAAPTVNVTEDGLILPRRLVNPCLESRERLDLHRELRFNAKA